MSLNSIEQLPENIGGNNNNGIEEEGGGFPFLTKLICRNNLLTFLPESLFQLSLLAILDISNNYIGPSLSSSFQFLLNLVDLKCENNKLEFIPNELCLLPKLVNLNLNKNKLKYLPENIGQLSVLQNLSCMYSLFLSSLSCFNLSFYTIYISIYIY